MKDVINVDKILKYLAEEIADQFGGDYDDNPNPGEEQRAKASLHSLLISKLPEKKPLVLEKEYSTPRELLPQEQEIKLNTNHQVIGFNQAVDDMHRVIDEMFGERE